MELAEPSVWDDPNRAQELGRERSSLETVVKTIENLDSGISDCRDCWKWQRKRVTRTRWPRSPAK